MFNRFAKGMTPRSVVNQCKLRHSRSSVLPLNRSASIVAGYQLAVAAGT